MEWTPEKVKDLRQHVGWTQPELAEYLGYGEAGAAVRVSELENGKRGISGPVGRLLDMLSEKHNYNPADSEK